MASTVVLKKRPRECEDSAGKESTEPRPTKKQLRAAQYHSSSEESGSEEHGTAPPADLMDDSDEGDEFDVNGMSSGVEDEKETHSRDLKRRSETNAAREMDVDCDGVEKSDEEGGFAGKEDSDDSGDDDSDADSLGPFAERPCKPKKKRDDETAFATSINKILSSKLSTTRRADPIVSRSTESAAVARQVADAALEAKARRRLREAKLLALERGRVRDVLVPSTRRTLDIATGEIFEEEEETTAREMLETEKRLRKTAQKGVVRMFNAVRAAQVKAAEATEEVRANAAGKGIYGRARKEEKVTEMSRKGFLDLIASGGGKLKKGPLEEA